MATISEKRDKGGRLTGYKILSCVGRDEHCKQVWKSATIKVDDPRISGLTPAKQRKEVQAIAHAIENEWKETFQVSPQQLSRKPEQYTLAAFLEIWQRNCESGWKPNTRRNFRERSKTVTEFFGSKIRLSEISRLEVDRFISWMRTEKGYSSGTIQCVATALRCAFQYAVDTGALKKSPLANYRLKNTDVEPERVDYLKPEEAAIFLNALDAEADRTRSLHWPLYGKILLFCGLRKGECAALKWSDYNAEMRRLTIKANVSRDNGGSVVLTTKTRRIRTVPVPEGLAEAIERYRAEEIQRYGGAIVDEAFMFHPPENPAKPLGESTPGIWLGRLKKRYPELPERLHLHLLRHTTASLLIAGGGDLTLARDLLGHSDVALTSRFYAGAQDELLRKSVNQLEELVSGTKTE